MFVNIPRSDSAMLKRLGFDKIKTRVAQHMSYFVYILYSLKDNKFYVGKTNDLSKRLERHNKGGVKSTKHRRPFKLVYYKSFKNSQEAFLREKELKQPSAGKFKEELRKKLAL